MFVSAAMFTKNSYCRTRRPADRRLAAAGALAAALLAATPASAFFQQTALEGLVGTDIGGVWLSVQEIMPEIRVSYPKPATGKAVPFTVAPMTDEARTIMGPKAGGVMLQSCEGRNFCAEQGLMEGDVVIRINSQDITDVASFERATENPSQQVMISIRRPALRMSTVRLFKLKYENKGQETQEGSEQHETLDVQLLDVALPFDEQLEESRQKHTRFEPSAAEVETLRTKWFELPPTSPARYFSGQNRFVAKASFDQPLESDKMLRDAKFAMILNMEGNPMQGGGKAIDVYGIESISPTEMEGNYITVTMASAPFPINIEFKGRFRMKKLADWSDQDDRLRMQKAQTTKPKEDLNKFKTAPDVPAPGRAGPPPAGEPKTATESETK